MARFQYLAEIWEYASLLQVLKNKEANFQSYIYFYIVWNSTNAHSSKGRAIVRTRSRAVTWKEGTLIQDMILCISGYALAQSKLESEEPRLESLLQIGNTGIWAAS